jgi:ABC-type phosphate transport system substrate-binding protein
MPHHPSRRRVRRTAALASAVAAATAVTLVVSAPNPAQADFSPQPKDVVSTGSDIIQNSFNFLADGYLQLPGYNTAGNRYRFVNFDSSGDAQGRSAFTDPRLLETIEGNGTIGENGVKYVKQSDLRLLNPTISLRAGQPLVVRPTGGGAGGRDAIIRDPNKWIDVGRSPDPLNADHQTQALSLQGSKLIRVQIATDRQLIATATTTNAPTTLSGQAILNIYNGTYRTWSDVPGYTGPNATETIRPLILPTDAGMWNTFVANVRKQNPGVTIDSGTLRANPNSIQVQQNDPTSITSLGDLAERNAIMPFPRGRFRTLESGYYTQTKESEGTLAVPKTNLYNTDPGGRTSASAQGIKLLDPNSTSDVASPTAPYGGNFAYNAIVRESDYLDATPWQPGSTLNWVQALFYNPEGPAPFVRTPAGRALLEAAGVTPDYHVFGTDNAEIPLD